MTRKIAIAIAALMVLLLLAGPALMDLSGVKGEIAARLEQALGRRVSIAGPLRVRLLPAPTLTVEGVAVGAEPLAEIAALTLGLRVWPLLSGRVEVEALELSHPRFHPRPDLDVAFDMIALSLVSPGAVTGVLNWRGAPVGIEARLGEVGPGRVTPAKLSVRLPGADAHLDFQGTLTGNDLSGRLTAGADTPEKLSAALGGLSVPGQALAAEATLTANPAEATLSNLAIISGSTRVTGSLVAALTGTPRIDLALNAPSIDFDGWIAASRPVTAPSAAAREAAPPVATAPERAFHLPLKLFINAEMGVEALTWRGKLARDARIEATLDEGELVLDRAQVILPGTSRISADGTLSAKDGKPVFEGRVQAGSDDLPALLAWGGPEAVGLPGNRLSAAAAITANGDQLTLGDLRLSIDGVETRGGASIGLGGVPRPLSLALTVDGRDHGPLLPAEVNLAADLADGALVVRQATARLGGGAALMTVAGQVDNPLGRRHYRLDLGAHANNPAALSLAVKLDGDDHMIALSELDATSGPTHFTGALRVVRGDGGPVLAGRLEADSIDLGTWAPGEAVAAPPSPAAGRKGRAAARSPAIPVAAVGGAPWSHQPFNLAPLKALDVNLDLGVAALTWRGWRIENASAHLGIEGGNARIDRLTAKWLGGDLAATARVTGGSLPQVSGTVSLAGADLAKLGQGAGKFRLSQGFAAGQARFTLVGRSSSELAARLSGDGRFEVKNGMAEGFDLPAVNAQLKDLKNIGNVFALAQAGLGGGRTHFTTLTGTIRAESGVVSIRDAKLDADGGTATAEASADLGRWTQESRIAIRVDQGNAPPVILRFDGPLDNPRKTIDLNDLQHALVAHGLGSALKAAAQPDQDGKPPSTAKVLQNLLRGLGGK